MARRFPPVFARSGLLILCGSLALASAADARLKLPALFGDNMVLQRGQADPVWGWDSPGTTVTVSIAGQAKTALADAAGKWRLKLDPLPASKEPLTMIVKGTRAVEVKNILVGEVWLCSGQSNMELPLNSVWNAEVEAASMRHPGLRFVTVPGFGTQDPQDDFSGAWKACTPENTPTFSALALFYGRYLHLALDVPVGLIQNAVGGSDIVAWMDRRALEADPQFSEIIADCVKAERRALDPRTLAKFESDVIAYDAAMEKWRAEVEKNPLSELPRPHSPKDPRDFTAGNARAGNLFNSALHPLIGFGIKGTIWYQGETNVPDPASYGRLFPKLITGWREAWGQGDFPFYWVQLPGNGKTQDEPGESGWAALREAQALALSLPRTGQCVTIDLAGDGDLHPKNKLDVAARLARWALANDYGMPMPFRSPEFKSMTVANDKIIVSFRHPGSGLKSGDPAGFAICGEDRKWFRATAKVIDPEHVEVSSPQVSQPAAVRYGWADNPGATLYTRDALPVTPFRTDNFELPKPQKGSRIGAPNPVEKK
jgi:sialate O-acetylesterase